MKRFSFSTSINDEQIEHISISRVEIKYTYNRSRPIDTNFELEIERLKNLQVKQNKLLVGKESYFKRLRETLNCIE